MQYAFELQGVSKAYPQFELQPLHLALTKGSIMGLVGINGAGKSTTLRILMGLIAADSGTVQVLGCQLPAQQVQAKRQIGYASEDMRLYRTKDLNWHMGFIANLFPDWDRQYAKHLLHTFNLKSDQPLSGFSHGQRVKACLLLVLARKPALLLLDEPTTGLDPVARAEVIEELATVLQDDNRSVLFSSHNTHDIQQLSDQISFLHDGKLLAAQDTDSFVDSWRCIRCLGQPSQGQIQLPGLAECRQNGSLLNLKVSEFSAMTLPQLQAQGLQITEVLPMDLEEIFVASVRKEMQHAV